MALKFSISKMRFCYLPIFVVATVGLLFTLLESSLIMAKNRIFVSERSLPQQAIIPHSRQTHDAIKAVDGSTAIAYKIAIGALPAYRQDELKSLLVEVGLLVLFQAFGFPVFGRLARFLRIGHLRLTTLRTLNPKHLRVLQASYSRVWKGLLAGYSRTSASKIVNRSKKIFHVFLPHGDDEDHLQHKCD